MTWWRSGVWLLGVAVAAGGCASAPGVEIHFAAQETFSIPGIDACDDFATARVHVDPTQPLTLLVHGCKASSGRFRTLARVLAASGRQTLCFNYNYRRSIRSTSAQLAGALAALEERLADASITVIGHSQGGLVARQALVERGDEDRTLASVPGFHLVTLASPFNGIQASAHCGLPVMHVVTLGIAAAVCQAAVGSIWPEIHPRAESVTNPQALSPGVVEHLHIATDERDSCRLLDSDGSCIDDDFVFSLSEQLNAEILTDERVQNVKVRAGHVAIVGDDDRPPWQLLGLLQEHGVMPPTPPGQLAAMRELVARLY